MHVPERKISKDTHDHSHLPWQGICIKEALKTPMVTQSLSMEPCFVSP